MAFSISTNMVGTPALSKPTQKDVDAAELRRDDARQKAWKAEASYEYAQAHIKKAMAADGDRQRMLLATCVCKTYGACLAAELEVSRKLHRLFGSNG